MPLSRELGSHTGHVFLGGRVTELTGCQGSPGLPAPSPPTARRQLAERGAQMAACSQGQGWASPHGVLTASAPPSGRSPSWTRSSCIVRRMCVAAPNMSVVSGEMQPGWVGHGWASQAGAGVSAGLPATVATLHAPPVKASVCVSRELGVMQPGQTVVELSADGVCHTSRCTYVLDPLSGFYQINTTSVLCDVHCEAVGAARGDSVGGQEAGLAEPGCSGNQRGPRRPLVPPSGERGRGQEGNSESEGRGR